MRDTRVKKNFCAFSAKIHKVGVNPCVEVPESVGICLGQTGYIPVTGTLNGFPIRATIVPVGNGRHRLYINVEMRKRVNAAVGDQVHLALALGTKPREVSTPPAFAAALKDNEKAKAAFEKLSPSHQKEVLAYLNYLKKPETLERNIEKVIKSLLKPKNDKKNAP